MEKSVFKEGDRVFEYKNGWGTVRDIIGGTHWHSVMVEFDNILPVTTQMDSFYLSFTEYKLEGFSQERPEELPKKGDIVWASNHKSDWYICYFLEKDSIGGYKVTSHSPFVKNPSYSIFTFITTENPYKDE
jgi:hypothetical protein